MLGNYAVSDGRGEIEILHNEQRLEGSKIAIGYLFGPISGVDEDDIIWIGTYVVESIAFSGRRVTLSCVDATLLLGETDALRIITDADFPRAPTETYGKAMPIIVGTVPKAPLLPVDTGHHSALDGSLSADPGDNVIRVATITEFPDSGIVVIDEEHIQYNEKHNEDRTLGTLSSPVQRAIAGTAVAAHADGAVVSVYKGRMIYLSQTMNVRKSMMCR